jgi:DNA-binding transcriptional ArsR family regulator
MPRLAPSTQDFLKALSNEKRLLVLECLLNPTAHFPPQVDGDLEADGVCLGAIARKLGVTQPTGTAHMKVLAEAGLVSAKQIKNWVFYKPCKDAIARSLAMLSDRLVGALDVPRRQ